MNTMPHNNPDPNDTSIRQLTTEEMHDQMLQMWLTEAADLRKLINSAKTATKRQFYTKKFKKLSKDIIAMIASRGFVSEYVKAAARRRDVEDVINAAE